MGRSALLLALGLVFLGPSASSAEEATPDTLPEPAGEFVPTGLYLNIGLLVAFDDFDSEIPLAGLPIAKTDEAFGLATRFGKRLHRHLAIEGEFDWFEKMDVRLDNGHKGRPHTDLEVWVLSASAKGYLSWGRLQPFAKLGVGVMHAKLRAEDEDRLSSDPKDSDFVMRFGGGLDLYATQKVAIVIAADYVLPVDTLKELPFVALSLGLQLDF